MSFDMRIKEVLSLNQANIKIKICGWVKTRRDTKAFSFIEISDGSCISSLQIFADSSLPNYESEILKITTGSAIECEGLLKDSPGKGQKYELHATKINILSYAPQNYPLQKKHHSLEFLREIAHLRPRTNTIAAVMRLRHSMSIAIHNFFNDRGFFYIHTPIISASDCEGAGEMFRVTTLLKEKDIPRNEKGEIDYSKDFFGKKTGLTVSGQLEAEAYALALGRVYTFGPTFRAENSNTARHLSEFWMVEPEASFFTLEDDMNLAEDFIKYLVDYALTKNFDEIDFFTRHYDPLLYDSLKKIVKDPFKRIPYTEAIQMLEKENENFEFKVKWGSDIQSEHERFLTEKSFSSPVIVFDYPKNIKAFYMKQNSDQKTVRAMDVLVPKIGELIGGSEREDRLEFLENRMKELGFNMQDYWWYLDLRKFGSAPHSGFGLGFERLMLFLTGIQNIRDVIPFPRWPANAEF